jgi:hypothetical protein
MTPTVRTTLAVVGSFTVAAYIALVWLTAALGGPWQLVAACIVALCGLSLAAFLGLAWRSRESADDPTVEPDEELAQGLGRLIAEGRIDDVDDRNRWQS